MCLLHALLYAHSGRQLSHGTTTTLQHATTDEPLTTALSTQCDAARLGFDWPDITGVFDKLKEEIVEFRQAIDTNDPAAIQHELGDILFSAVNLARFVDVPPAEALTRATQRFEARFAAVQSTLEHQGRAIDACTLEELDELWEEAKGGEQAGR